MAKSTKFIPLLVKGGVKNRAYDSSVEVDTSSLHINHIITVKVGNKEQIHSFNMMESSIATRIPNYLTLSPESVIRFSYKLVCFACRIIGASETKQLPGISKEHLMDVKERFYASDTCAQVKIAVLRCLVRKLKPFDLIAISDEFEGCGLARTDRIFYTLLWDTGHINLVIDMFKTAVENAEKCELSFNAIKAELNKEYMDSLFKTAMFFTTRKLRFIVLSNRMSFNDMAAELVSRAIPAYYWVRPYYTRKHALNYTKQAIRGWVQRTIQYYTDPSRARMIKDGQGHTNVTRDLDESTLSDCYSEDKLIEHIDNKRATHLRLLQG